VLDHRVQVAQHRLLGLQVLGAPEGEQGPAHRGQPIGRDVAPYSSAAFMFGTLWPVNPPGIPPVDPMEGVMGGMLWPPKEADAVRGVGLFWYPWDPMGTRRR